MSTLYSWRIWCYKICFSFENKGISNDLKPQPAFNRIECLFTDTESIKERKGTSSRFLHHIDSKQQPTDLCLNLSVNVFNPERTPAEAESKKH